MGRNEDENVGVGEEPERSIRRPLRFPVNGRHGPVHYAWRKLDELHLKVGAHGYGWLMVCTNRTRRARLLRAYHVNGEAYKTYIDLSFESGPRPVCCAS